MLNNIQDIMQQLGEKEFYLPVGYTDVEGTLHRRVKLTPMTGDTEEAIANPKLRDNVGKMITELLFSVVTDLGTVKKLNREVINNLSSIDRDFLIVKNAQVSVGEVVEYVDSCPHCRGKNEVSVDLTQLPVEYLDDEEPREYTFDLPDGYKDKDGVIHKTITVMLPTGKVQERVAQTIRVNPAQATTMMLQLITKKLGTLDFLSPDIFRAMTKKDRTFISKKLNEIHAGLQLSHPVICAECGEEYNSNIPFPTLLGE